MRTQRGYFFLKEKALKQQYNKPPLTIEKQADLLLSRGLQGISKSDLEEKLKSINYYRLRGYTYPYQDNSLPDSPFLKSNNWQFIWNDYVMDSRLRSLIFESIGHIEIAFRTQLELVMSLKYGSRWYSDNRYFFNKSRFSKDFAELEDDWNRSQEDFKIHYETKYDDTIVPPAWMIFETSTFGVVSKFYSNIDSVVPEKADIAAYFGFSKAAIKILVSWIHHLNTVRNICAHHSRLYSKSIITRPIFPKHISGKWVSTWSADDRIYATICIIKKLLDICAPDFDFINQLKPIIKMARKEQFPSMGIPETWENEALFKN